MNRPAAMDAFVCVAVRVLSPARRDSSVWGYAERPPSIGRTRSLGDRRHFDGDHNPISRPGSLKLAFQLPSNRTHFLKVWRLRRCERRESQHQK